LTCDVIARGFARFGCDVDPYTADERDVILEYFSTQQVQSVRVLPVLDWHPAQRGNRAALG
jgi:hypothetical protein